MSTVDSLLIVAGSALAYDLYGSILGKDASPRQRERVDRFGVALVGAVPLVLLLSGVGEGELVQFIVLLFTALMGASFFAPVVFGVFWRRATREGAIAAMLGGVIVTFLWKAAGPEHIDPVLPGFLSSTLLLVGISLMTPRPPAAALEPYFGDPGSSEAAPD